MFFITMVQGSISVTFLVYLEYRTDFQIKIQIRCSDLAGAVDLWRMWVCVVITLLQLNKIVLMRFCVPGITTVYLSPILKNYGDNSLHSPFFGSFKTFRSTWQNLQQYILGIKFSMRWDRNQIYNRIQTPPI